MSDYLVRATAANAQIRAFAVTARDIAEEARQRHNLSPVACAGLGRLMCGGLMMGSMLGSEEDLLTLRVKGEGPMEGLMVTADAKGTVKGYADVPDVVLPPNAKGKLDVGGALMPGYLTVIKDMGLKEPYSSRIYLQTGEIADDLTYYFASSEQVPSSVGLGVLMNRDNTVKCAGGFIIQLMPFTDDATISKLEKILSEVDSVTSMLDKGMSPEDILEHLLGELGLEITDKQPVKFACNCSKEKVEKVLMSLNKKDMKEIVDDGKPVTLNCQFCGQDYTFDIDEIKALAKKRSV